METRDAGTPSTGLGRTRLRAAHVALALLALVIVVAAGSLLLPKGAPASQSVAGLELSVVDAAYKVERDSLGCALNLMAPVPAVETLSDDGMLVAEAEAQVRVDDALIVRTASLELEVDDVAATLRDARGEIAALGGYVSGSDEYDQGETRWASVTYRVPVERFGEAIDALRGLATRVVRESTQSTEVTATVIDLDARIANLRASEAALVEIMDRAGRIEDVLAVQMRLEDVRGQIEILEAQRANLADQAALSTLTVSWFTPVAAVAIAQEGWDLGMEIDVALAQTVEALQRVASLGVWLAVVALPLVGLPLLLLAVALVLVRRRARSSGTAGGPEGGSLVASAAE
ncbi:MAG TPA: DUF4349 domain-containing protein [Candidatus Limnocylindrales bacterium]|nr:DUF4349 domain-containing protein [Candidatus Limnocylindrales bacterium]